MSRCIACNKVLNQYELSSNKGEEGHEYQEDMCSECIGYAYMEWQMTTDHEWVLGRAKEGVTDPCPCQE